MFQLIISILAILLAVALAGIAVFYGSDAFTGGKAKAEATTIINQASQIEAAMTLYNSQNKGQLDVGGRTSTADGTGLFAYLLGGDYLKTAPDGNGGTWELKCVDSANQSLFEGGADGDTSTSDAGQDDPASCGPEGVALTLNGVEPEQCNLINVLLDYTYTTENVGAGISIGDLATEDGYVPTCTDEPGAPCCDS